MGSEITLNDYKLSCELLGHSADVRTVEKIDNDCILSGSRDKTVRIWRKKEKDYSEEYCFKDHTNYISCILYLKDEDWICTGSNDNTICIYKRGTLIPFVVLNGHTSNVCALAKGIELKRIISGSWDKTGRIWTIDENGTSTFISLNGHEAAVWAVTAVGKKKYATGSADKTIIYWNEKGEKLRILKEHQDCIRGLIGLDDGSLISCSNDATIKYWNDEGECVHELYGHNNYIYTMALNKSVGKDVVVSGSEDNTIRMWSLTSGSLGDALYLPANSVWSVVCLENGDIVTGTSDGVVRVFTRDPERFADEEKLKAFCLAVEIQKQQSNQELGGIKHKDLPGPESLLQPGNEGQTKIVRHPDGKILCYQWKGNEWEVIGDVMGASGGTQASSGKTLYEGKEYDYVFNVDISETDPAIKLPYNRNDDPWLTAQHFIYKHNLPQVYLDQIANFIIKNADAPIKLTNSGFADPFTGGSRYIPGSTASNSTTVGNADPFTGDASYTTSNNTNKKKHFPINQYTTFDSYDLTKIYDKLKEFNKSAALSNMGVDEDLLLSVAKLAHKEESFDSVSIKTLEILLAWPEDILFPVLDIARLSVRNEELCKILFHTNFVDTIIGKLSSLPANQLMSTRCLVNMLKHSYGQNYLQMKLNEVIEKTKYIKQGNSNLQIALASLFLNITVFQNEISNIESFELILNGIIEFWKWCTDFEAFYRCLQAIGNIFYSSYGEYAKARIISSKNMIDKIKEFSTNSQSNNLEKLSECAKDLLSIF